MLYQHFKKLQQCDRWSRCHFNSALNLPRSKSILHSLRFCEVKPLSLLTCKQLGGALRGRLSQNGERWRRREERARMMKRTLTASPKVLPFTFRFPLPLSLTLQVSSKRQNSAKSLPSLFPQRDLTRQQRQHDPLTIGHPVVISLSQAAAGFLRGSEFQFSPSTPFPPLPPFISSLLQRI